MQKKKLIAVFGAAAITFNCLSSYVNAQELIEENLVETISEEITNEEATESSETSEGSDDNTINEEAGSNEDGVSEDEAESLVEEAEEDAETEDSEEECQHENTHVEKNDVTEDGIHTHSIVCDDCDEVIETVECDLRYEYDEEAHKHHVICDECGLDELEACESEVTAEGTKCKHCGHKVETVYVSVSVFGKEDGLFKELRMFKLEMGKTRFDKLERVKAYGKPVTELVEFPEEITEDLDYVVYL